MELSIILTEQDEQPVKDDEVRMAVLLDTGKLLPPTKDWQSKPEVIFRGE